MLSCGVNVSRDLNLPPPPPPLSRDGFVCQANEQVRKGVLSKMICQVMAARRSVCNERREDERHIRGTSCSPCLALNTGLLSRSNVRQQVRVYKQLCWHPLNHFRSTGLEREVEGGPHLLCLSLGPPAPNFTLVALKRKKIKTKKDERWNS